MALSWGPLRLLAQLAPSLWPRGPVSAADDEDLKGPRHQRRRLAHGPLIGGSAHARPGQLRGSQARKDLQTCALVPGAVGEVGLTESGRIGDRLQLGALGRHWIA